MFHVASSISDSYNFNKNSISPLIDCTITDKVFIVLHNSICRFSGMVKFKTS